MNYKKLFDEALKFHQIEIIVFLLNNYEVDPHYDYNYVLRWATYYRETELVRLLLNNPRINVEDHNNYVIYWSATFDYADIVEMALNHPKIDPSFNYNQALRTAFLHNSIESIKLLVRDWRVIDMAKRLYQRELLDTIEEYSKVLNKVADI